MLSDEEIELYIQDWSCTGWGDRIGEIVRISRAIESAAIDAFLSRTGKYLTNDESREAAIADATAPLLERIAELEKLSVTNIMLSISPGFDGMGEEVYAESVSDVEQKLGDMGQELEEWHLGIKRNHAMKERIAELERQLEEAKKDAERYRWLRKQHWSENLISVVVRPKDNTILGSMLPCGSLLDDTVDHMKSIQDSTQKGQL